MTKSYIVLFLFGAILTPPLRLFSGLPSLRLEMVVVLVAIAAGKIELNHNDTITSIFTWLVAIACLAITSSYLLFDTPFNHSDFMILPMLLQYWLVYCFSKSIQNIRLRLYTLKIFAAFVGLSALFGVFQKFNIAGVNSWLSPHFTYANTIDIALYALITGADWARVVGTVGDPRHYSFVLAIGVGAVLSIMQHPITHKERIFYSIPGLLCIIALFFAASRTGLAAMLLALFVGLYLSKVSSRQFVNYLLVAGMTAPVLFGMWVGVAPQATKERILSTSNRSYISSMHARTRDLQEPIKEGIENPLIFITGRGPAKSVLPGSEHTDMGWMALRYGLLGLACYLTLFYRSWKLAIKRYRKLSPIEEKTVSIFLAMSIGIWFLYAQAESIFKLGQLMSLNLFVVGMIFAKPLPKKNDSINRTRIVSKFPKLRIPYPTGVSFRKRV